PRWTYPKKYLSSFRSYLPSRPRRIALKEETENNQAVACTGPRPSFKRFCRQFERCLTIQSSSAFSNPISDPAFSLSIHLCFKISSRSARNSLYSTEFLTNWDCASWGIWRLFSIKVG